MAQSPKCLSHEREGLSSIPRILVKSYAWGSVPVHTCGHAYAHNHTRHTHTHTPRQQEGINRIYVEQTFHWVVDLVLDSPRRLSLDQPSISDGKTTEKRLSTEAGVGFSKLYLSCFNFSPELGIDHSGPVGGIVPFGRGCHTTAAILPLGPLSALLTL